MISISKLLCDVDAEGDGLPSDAAATSTKLPITAATHARTVLV